MSLWYILDDDGNPVPEPDSLKAATWIYENKNKTQIDLTEIADDHYLSTVFLGLNHSYRFSLSQSDESPSRPILYESMWFGGPHDGEMRRYSTREEALIGHNEMLELLFKPDQNKPWFIDLEKLFDRNE